MRLTELEPRWTGYAIGANHIFTGITFLCPHCKSIRLGISFKEPIDPDERLEEMAWDTSILAWHREGTTFETITLRPSINTEHHGHWHGVITNGEIQP